MELGYGVIDYDEFCEAMENINFETKNDSNELSEQKVNNQFWNFSVDIWWWQKPET